MTRFPRCVGTTGVAEVVEDTDGARRETAGDDSLVRADGAGEAAPFL